jgi:hypothetical protein
MLGVTRNPLAEYPPLSGKERKRLAHRAVHFNRPAP